jgi:hypothetical protein
VVINHQPSTFGARTYLSVIEKIPLANLMLVIHAVLISAIMAISNVGRSEITHVHVSIPAAMADGVKTSKGKATI